MLALTVTGSAALAALVAVKQRRAKLAETTAEHKKDLQRWEDDTGNVLPATPINHPS